MGWKLITASALSATVLATAGTGWWLDNQYHHDVATIDNNWTPPPTPSAPPQPSATVTPTPAPTLTEDVYSSKPDMTILLLGSDSRTGSQNETLGGGPMEGARSDTQILAHLHRGWNRAELVSIPRDIMVDITESRACPELGHVRINAAYSAAGASCAAQTITNLTGQTIDHIVSIDFAGTVNAVDAVGGMRVCLTDPVADADAQLHLPAGSHTLDGTEALSLLRVRKSLGGGSDLERTARQRYLLTTLATQVADSVASNPTSLPSLLSTMWDSVTTDKNLSPTLAANLLKSAALHPPSIRTAMLPVQPDPDNPHNTVVIDKSPAQRLFSTWTATAAPSANTLTDPPSAASGSPGSSSPNVPRPGAPTTPASTAPGSSTSSPDSEPVPYPFC